MEADDPGSRVLARVGEGAAHAVALCARLLEADCAEEAAAREVAAVRALAGAAPRDVRAAAAALLLDFALAPEADFCLRPTPVCAALVDRLAAAREHRGASAGPAALAHAWRAFAAAYPPAAHAASPAPALALPFPKPQVPACAVGIFSSEEKEQEQERCKIECDDDDDKEQEQEEKEEDDDLFHDDDEDEETTLGTMLTVTRSGAVAVEAGSGLRLTPPPRVRHAATLRDTALHNCAILAAAFAALIASEGDDDDDDDDNNSNTMAEIGAELLLRRIAPTDGCAPPNAAAYAAVLPKPTGFASDARAQRLFAQNPVLYAVLAAVLAARPVRCAARLAAPLVGVLAGCVAEWHACPATAPPALRARTHTLLRLLVRARRVPPPLAAIALVLPPACPLRPRDVAAALRAFLLHCAGGVSAPAAAATVRAVLLRHPCTATLPLLQLFSGTVLQGP